MQVHCGQLLIFWLGDKMTISASTLGPTSSTGWGNWTNIRGRFNVALGQTTNTTGTWSGLIKTQRKFTSASTNYYHVEAFSANTQQTGFEPEDEVFYRIGLTSITSATNKMLLRLSQ